VDVTLTRYPASLDYLFARTTGAFKFGLERTQALLVELGDPHRRYPVIHIAGTNGKGSAVATADALLRARGLRVGRYTSPHLVDFRERIAVDGRAIGEAQVIEFIDRWTPAVERLGATFFEATTAMAFAHFADAAVDVALIETGLGGRLDSTNVVHPVAAGVTSIGLDHVEYLGGTLREIASEKAGIFKEGVPAVIGERDPDVRGWLAEAARRAGASSVRVVADEMQATGVELTPAGTRFRLAAFGGGSEVCTPLLGRHQAANFAFTLALLDAAGGRFAVPLDEAARSVGGVALPGRFQRSGQWILDVAHNPDGAATVAATLGSVAGQGAVTVLLCVLADKDWRAMIQALAPVAARFILTNAPSAPDIRRWPLPDVVAHCAAAGVPAIAEADFDRALALAAATPETVLVTGSFHTVGDAMARLQLSPLTG
jgi:dihydrofolate synthase/folylpolyglutamate synthase